MERFRDDGHLTDQAIQALVENRELEELERLEMAEHLAFCDLCLQRYTDALTGTELLVPETSCQQSLWVRVRTRTLRLVTSRYATAAAAVALALTMLWGSGEQGVIRLPQMPERERPAISENLDSWSSRWSSSLDGAVSGVHDFFSGLGSQRPDTNQGGNNT